MRRLRWFSCGAPSAVAAKLTVQEHPDAEVPDIQCGLVCHMVDQQIKGAE